MKGKRLVMFGYLIMAFLMLTGIHMSYGAVTGKISGVITDAANSDIPLVNFNWTAEPVRKDV